METTEYLKPRISRERLARFVHSRNPGNAARADAAPRQIAAAEHSISRAAHQSGIRWRSEALRNALPEVPVYYRESTVDCGLCPPVISYS